MISLLRIPISRCTTGIYLRWWLNGFHYWNFTNGYEINMSSESMDTQVTNMFSRISKIERATRYKIDYSYQIILDGIREGDVPAFEGLLLAEKVEQYEGGLWYEVEITRGDHVIKDQDAPGYVLDFEITRRELPLSSTVLQKSLLLYIGSTLCDLDYDEVVPVNKQVNDIAEMQDRQSDYTAQFKIRKTRRMKTLFELSGDVGIVTTFPYENQSCKLIQDGIEMIYNGYLILDKSDDSYYYVSIYSGNLNFFKEIEPLKLYDLRLQTTDEHWDKEAQKASHDYELDYLYPLLEPSDDGAILPPSISVNILSIKGNYIWPFVRVSAIWNEIFANAGFYKTGDILSNDTFLNLWMPITNLKITKEFTNKYLYSFYWWGPVSTLNCDDAFLLGSYTAPFTASYKIQVFVIALAPPVAIGLSVNSVPIGNLTLVSSTWAGYYLEITYPATVGDLLQITGLIGVYLLYNLVILEINDATIGYVPGAIRFLRLHLPDMTQTDFIKCICNMFGLIPDVDPRSRIITFWNYTKLYDNIPIARDWSAYLSEREDESEFKFGEYAQRNKLKYKESKDVLKGNGDGTILVEDETLPSEKDVVTLAVSTCDEVAIATTLPMNVSRIAFNEHDANAATYTPAETIDPRFVYIKRSDDRSLVINAPDELSHVDVTDPKTATSVDISFSYLVTNYAGLSRMLTKTNLRRCKFNLPAYEVAGLKHYIPIYLSQYKAYFYVNKINNYVPGKLCIIDLIKL
jgi:hypothetical protein